MADFDSDGKVTLADLLSILNQCVLEEKNGIYQLEEESIDRSHHPEVTL